MAAEKIYAYNGYTETMGEMAENYGRTWREG